MDYSNECSLVRDRAVVAAREEIRPSLPGEIWKDVLGYEERYMVSNLGRVWRKSYEFHHRNMYVECVKHSKAGFVYQQKTKKGYLNVGLCSNGEKKIFPVHRLVARAFVDGYFEGAVVNHKDECKTNNVVTNLEWCTPEYNTRFGTRTERASRSNQQPVIQMTLDGVEIARYESVNSAALAIGADRSIIGPVCRGKRKSAGGFKWKYAV